MTLRVHFHIFRKNLENNPQCTIILGGDFNVGDIDWNSHTVVQHSQKREINEKIQIQIEPTRLSKTLDLLCTNKPGLFTEAWASAGGGKGGHLPPPGKSKFEKIT